MEIGDKVILNKDLGPFKAGAEGIVRYKDKDGNLKVEITHDENCNPVTFPLPYAPPDTFSPGSKCT